MVKDGLMTMDPFDPNISEDILMLVAFISTVVWVWTGLVG